MWRRTVDRWSIYIVIFLYTIGVLLSFSSSPPLAENRELDVMLLIGKHAAFGLIALALMVVVSMLSVRNARRLGCVVFGLALLLLLLLPYFGTNFDKGAMRWYSLGAFGSLQPSEFIKPALIMFSAWLIADARDGLGNITVFHLFNVNIGYFWFILFTGAVIASLVTQPDFGQAFLVFVGGCIVYFVSGASLLPLYFFACLAVVVGYLAYQHSEHFQSRIDDYITHMIGDGSSRYEQLDIATNAIINGGLLGMGPGNGTVKWHLADAHTDLIIAVAVEEYGLAGIGIIVMLFVILFWLSISRLKQTRDSFVRIAGVGLITTFSCQALINLLVTMRLIPAKGMTLPMISQGGSSLLAVGLLLGLLFALTRKPIEDTMPGLNGGHC
ncbi:MAG: FtsW/RodA/SpoVE family cell cycle protein, partial [Rhodobacteraceae bacterium]|nr:FtsW/RodA/SpoVE family cell cycle protein [Paracoccaceae bacterium]